MSSDDRENLRRLTLELRLLEGTAESLQARTNLVNAALSELNLAKMTLEGVGKETTDTSLFVPIGGGSFIKAKIESAEKVIVGIGAGVSIERTLTEAQQTIENRISEVEKNRVSIQQQLVQIVNKIQEDRDRLQNLSAKVSQAERRPNVPKTERRS